MQYFFVSPFFIASLWPPTVSYISHIFYVAPVSSHICCFGLSVCLSESFSFCIHCVWFFWLSQNGDVFTVVSLDCFPVGNPAAAELWYPTFHLYFYIFSCSFILSFRQLSFFLSPSRVNIDSLDWSVIRARAVLCKVEWFCADWVSFSYCLIIRIMVAVDWTNLPRV